MQRRLAKTYNNSFIIDLFNITFVKGYLENIKFSGIAQGWSLTVEETFYFLAPLLFILIKRNKISLLLLPITTVCAGLGLVKLLSGFSLWGLMASNEFMFNYTFFGRCAEFFIGIGLALFFKARPASGNTKFVTYTGITVILICIFSISAVKGNNDFGIHTPAGKLINNLILPLVGIAVFYHGLLTEKTIVSKILGSKLFVLLGKSSYVFYLIHMGTVAALLSVLTSNKILLFVLINIVSIALFSFIEELLNNFIRRKFNGTTLPKPVFQTT